MDELLTPVNTTKKSDVKNQQKVLIQDVSTVNITSFDEVLRILKDSPNQTQLQAVLDYLKDEQTDGQGAKASSAVVAQVINVLVTQTIPDWWERIRNDEGLAKLEVSLLQSLRDITPLGAMLSRIRILTASCKRKGQPRGDSSSQAQLASLLGAAEAVLNSTDIVQGIYRKSTQPQIPKARQAALWKEFVSIIASGRLLSASAEADEVLRISIDSRLHTSWLAQGKAYTSWLTQNIAASVRDHGPDDENLWTAMAGLTSKIFGLGYADILVETLIENLPLKNRKSLVSLKILIEHLPAYQQRNFLGSTSQYLSRKFLRNPVHVYDTKDLVKSSKHLRGSAALIRDLMADNEILLEHLMEVCIKLEGSALIVSELLRRTVLASLAHDEDRISAIMEKSMERFGDQLFIRHAPIVQQEATAQVLLMACGYVQRKQPMLLFAVAKSSTQTHGMSNRLKATSERARWLGMIVGMTISQLTDKPGSALTFEDESMETIEAQWYQALVKVDDKVGSIEDLELRDVAEEPGKTATLSIRKQAPNRTKQQQARRHTPAKVQPGVPSGLRIVELNGEDGDDVIIPYAKLDEDPEDEDEDPTLVERNKPKPPVYIRDLIAGLRDTGNYDHHCLALQTSTDLIRRKANFGKEVSDHAEELASILLNLNDDFEMEDFLKLRQEALIALLVAQPKLIAPYFARSCFEGSYSLQQRAAMLTALGLGARELAGFKDEDRPGVSNFPTKQLPEHLRQVYGAETAPSLAKVSGRLEQAMVEPMALKAADQLSGPNALKVRTFSSRMAVEKARKKPITNQLAKVVGENFFFPLIGGWWAQMQSIGSRSISFSKHLLPVYLRTLSIILHASGPSTLSLPQMTSEFWSLLLSLRSNAINDNDLGMLEGLLFSFLTLLDINEDKHRLANEHAKELVETQEWARLVLDRYGTSFDGVDKEGERVRMLAAAVVVRCHEIVEKWQRLMLGDLDL